MLSNLSLEKKRLFYLKYKNSSLIIYRSTTVDSALDSSIQCHYKRYWSINLLCLYLVIREQLQTVITFFVNGTKYSRIDKYTETYIGTGKNNTELLVEAMGDIAYIN